MSGPDADGARTEHPLFAGVRPGAPGLSRHEPGSASHCVPGSLRQLVQPHGRAAGRVRACRDGVVTTAACPTRGASSAADPGRGSARVDAGLSARQPLLRDRPAVRNRLAAVRQRPPGWARVQAICDFVHRHIAFGYEHARATRRRGRPIRKAWASAATTPISPSRSAAA